MSTKNEQEILIAEIHNDFDSAEERLLKEAQLIISNDDKAAKLKADRVSKLGFGSAKAAKDAKEISKQKSKASELVSTINYFKQNYPFNKFITEPEVKKLCEKYNLLLGDACDYIGDIPEKNLCEIENFKLHAEDYLPKQSVFSWYDNLEFMQRQMYQSMGIPTDVDSYGFVQGKKRRSGSNYLENYIRGFGPYQHEPLALKSTSANKKETVVETEKPSFKICAPKTEFKTSGMIVTDGYILKDPIVLQPVKGGYLIISKWGLEASDEIVVNEVEN